MRSNVTSVLEPSADVTSMTMMVLPRLSGVDEPGFCPFTSTPILGSGTVGVTLNVPMSHGRTPAGTHND